ncbi:MAG: 3-methylcrotonyl-CoA carboxylase, partial [Pseudomonadales bacterium]|nr:3-methylcrotonyl-CoA carboxylase [Pseudomonadales bacterium]
MSGPANNRITTLLIANRGEIACRIIRTARQLGLRTVAIYSDADTKALHVRLADVACHVGPAPATMSYLDVDRIIKLARETGADAIHPGYGFLSENESFARACEAAGIVFVGPTADAIRAMGSKGVARELMEKAGVPVLPGINELGDDLDAAAGIGFPLLIKPAAGGGGKGMKIVRERGALAAAVASARREAKSSFGDDRLIVERYLDGPRHVEVQVFGDR